MQKMKLVPFSQPDIQAKLIQSKLLQRKIQPKVFTQADIKPVQTNFRAADVKAKLLIGNLVKQKNRQILPVITESLNQASQTEHRKEEKSGQEEKVGPDPQAELDNTTKVLLTRYFNHIEKAKTYLEHNKGYTWNENGDIVNPSGKNLVDEIERLTALALLGREPSAMEDYSPSFSSNESNSTILQIPETPMHSTRQTLFGNTLASPKQSTPQVSPNEFIAEVSPVSSKRQSATPTGTARTLKRRAAIASNLKTKIINAQYKRDIGKKHQPYLFKFDE